MCYCYTTEVFFSFCLPARLMIVFHLPEHDLPCTVLARCSFPEKRNQRPVFPCPQRSLFVPVWDLSRLVSLLAPLVVLLVQFLIDHITMN
jgi:hypothetical protein